MAKKLWGGRFSKKTDPLVERFTKSVQYDHRLAEYDLLGSIAHVRILRRAGYLGAGEAAALTKALGAVKDAVCRGRFAPDLSVEDIHTQIQDAVERKAGPVALKLHTARSRNDQVIFATKLYCKFEIARMQGALMSLAVELLAQARKHAGVIMPGFTHMQHAQPVYLADHLAAYASMLTRDSARLNGIFTSLRLTMGSGALAGTPVDASLYHVKARDYLQGYGADGSFDIHPAYNALDTVSDRDFVIEIVAALALTATHLSRLAEDLILWSTKEFGFIELDDAYCTGSSLMPQKKNADVLELARGYAGRLCGDLVSVLVMMKGLPLSYNRDMQLDKEPLFNAFDVIGTELAVLAGVIRTLTVNRDRIAAHLQDESLYATDLVYYLVDLGVPFRKAHELVGGLVRYAQDTGIPMKALPEAALKEKLCPGVTKAEFLKRFDPAYSLKLKRSIKRK